MLDTVGENPQGQRLGMGNGFFSRSPIHQDAWKVGDFRYPPPIILAFQFDDELHDG